MIHSLINASVSMQGLQRKLDVLGHNIANVDTVGYKRQEASFKDLLNTRMQQPKGFEQRGRLTPLGLTQGFGSSIAQIQTNLEQGALQETGNPLDFALEGDGLFEVITSFTGEDGNPTRAWARAGSFSLSVLPDNPQATVLTDQNGNFISGADNNRILVPANHRLSISEDGQITAYSEADPNSAPIALGQLKLMQVIRPQMLQEISENLFTVPAELDQNDGILAVANNNPDRIEVAVHQGFVEKSNVQLEDAMTQMLVVQRAFQLNSRAISSSDNMMGLANNLRG